MPKRKRKKYSRPQRPFDKARIQEENILKDKYGLKNKKEIWKADAAIRRIRNLAKQLITKSEEDKKALKQPLGPMTHCQRPRGLSKGPFSPTVCRMTLF